MGEFQIVLLTVASSGTFKLFINVCSAYKMLHSESMTCLRYTVGYASIKFISCSGSYCQCISVSYTRYQSHQQVVHCYVQQSGILIRSLPEMHKPRSRMIASRVQLVVHNRIGLPYIQQLSGQILSNLCIVWHHHSLP